MTDACDMRIKCAVWQTLVLDTGILGCLACGRVADWMKCKTWVLGVGGIVPRCCVFGCYVCDEDIPGNQAMYDTAIKLLLPWCGIHSSAVLV